MEICHEFRYVRGLAEAPAMMPSKSSGKRCAYIIAWRPPFEQPEKYERVSFAP